MSSPEVLAAVIGGSAFCWPLRSVPEGASRGTGEQQRPAVDSGSRVRMSKSISRQMAT